MQGDLGLDIQLLDTSGSPLKAPEKGNMARMIRESISSRAFYRFHKKGCTLFDILSAVIVCGNVIWDATFPAG